MVCTSVLYRAWSTWILVYVSDWYPFACFVIARLIDPLELAPFCKGPNFYPTTPAVCYFQCFYPLHCAVHLYVFVDHAYCVYHPCVTMSYFLLLLMIAETMYLRQHVHQSPDPTSLKGKPSGSFLVPLHALYPALRSQIIERNNSRANVAKHCIFLHTTSRCRKFPNEKGPNHTEVCQRCATQRNKTSQHRPVLADSWILARPHAWAS